MYPSSSAFAQRTPKSALMEFWQVHNGIPHFEVQLDAPPPALPKFTCWLTMPSLQPGRDGEPTRTEFTADARTKKAAEHAAAKAALDYIMSLTQDGGAGPLRPAWPQHPPQLGMQSPTEPQGRAEANPPPLALTPAPGMFEGLLKKESSDAGAAGGGKANAEDIPSPESLLKFIDGLSREQTKKLLIEAQQRIMALEAQLAKYSDWHRRMRELALEDVGT